MKHIIIKNFGPLNDVDIELDNINLIIGLQGSGKSCVMMTACYCSWVEKRIMLRQSASEFEKGSVFIDMMLQYYRIRGYLHADTMIEYQTEFMEFSFCNAQSSGSKFTHQWNGQRWNYKRPKVSYIPAERNMISLIANWSRLETSYDSILDFKEDWDVAKKYMKTEKNILGMGISYEYNDSKGTDSVVTENGKDIELPCSSSGVQSVVPLYVHLDYLKNGIYKQETREKDRTLAEKQLINSLLDTFYQKYYKQTDNNMSFEDVRVVHIDGKDYPFLSEKNAKMFVKKVNNYLYTDHCEIFLEEPESNLFPPTQSQLMNFVIEMTSIKKHKNFFMIATHSPYILSYLLQEKIDGIGVFMTYRSDKMGLFSVKKANQEEMQQIYDNGSDVFFNFEAITH